MLIDQATLDEQVISPSSLTLSITPVLIKNGRMAITTVGNRSEITLAYFKQIIDKLDISGDEEIVDGVSISFKRTLSANSSFQLAVSRQESQTTQNNIVDDFNLSYNRQVSKRSSFSGKYRKTKQVSDVIGNEYDQDLISFKWNTTF